MHAVRPRGINHWFNLLASLLVLVNCVAHAGWQASLSESEITAVNETVTRLVQNQRRSNRSPVADASLGLQVLLIELQEIKTRAEEDPRLAEVFVFDYNSNEASVLFVDVGTQKVVSFRNIDNIHLPLSGQEVSEATQRLLNDDDLMRELAFEYERQTGQSLVSLEQLDMKVSIWNPGQTHAPSHQCQLTRCALVSLFTHGYYNFSIEPVVNLSTGRVDLSSVQ